MTDRRSLSRSLNVTAGSGIWDSEGGATVRSSKDWIKIKIGITCRIFSINADTVPLLYDQWMGCLERRQRPC